MVHKVQTKQEKKKTIDELAVIFKGPASVLVIEYRGLGVKSMQSVRRQVKETDAELRVVKNKLLHKACEGTDVEKIKNLFEGPTAIAICGQEFPATAKVFIQAHKEFEDFVLKGGLMDGKVCEAADIEQISKLPSRKVLISMFASTLLTPLSNFVSVMDQMRSGFVHSLEALRRAKESGEISDNPEEGRSGAAAKNGKTEMKVDENEQSKVPMENETEQSSDNQNKKEENSDG